MPFSLSRCPTGKNKIEEKSKRKTTTATAATTTTSKIRSNNPNSNSARKRKQPSSTGKLSPILSSRHKLNSPKLETLREDFLETSSSDEDNDKKRRKVASKKKKRISSSKTSPPIPSFQLGDLDSSDDEKDSFLLSLSVFRKGKNSNDKKELVPTIDNETPCNNDTSSMGKTTDVVGHDKMIEIPGASISESLPEEMKSNVDNEIEITDENIATLNDNEESGTSYVVNDINKVLDTTDVTRNNNYTNDGDVLPGSNNLDDTGTSRVLCLPKDGSQKGHKSIDSNLSTQIVDSKMPNAINTTDKESTMDTVAKSQSTNIYDVKGKGSKTEGKSRQNTPKQKKTESCDDSSLFQEIDEIFLTSGKEKISIRSLNMLLGKRIGIKLDKRTKQKAKEHFTGLVNGTIQPISSGLEECPSKLKSSVASEHQELTSDSSKLENLPQNMKTTEKTSLAINPNIDIDDSSLFQEVDKAFLISDKENTSVRCINALLEKNMGIKLDKPTKQKVKDRLIELINGTILPSPPKTGKHTSEESSLLAPECMESSYKADVKDDTVLTEPVGQLSSTNTHQLNDKVNETNPKTEETPNDYYKTHEGIRDDDEEIMALKTISVAAIDESSKSASHNEDNVPMKNVEEIQVGQQPDNLDDDDLIGRSENTTLAVKAMLLLGGPDLTSDTAHETQATSAESANEQLPRRNTDQLSNENTPSPVLASNTSESKTTGEGQALLQNQKGNNDNGATPDTHQSKQEQAKEMVSEEVITSAVEPEKENTQQEDEDFCEIIEQKDIPPPRANSSARQKRRNDVIDPNKNIRDREVNNFSLSKKTGKEGTDTRPWKRSKKKRSCALCTTCPCQKSQDVSDTSSLNLQTFARSDTAIEKALIRRVQKLEKSSEYLEEQADLVKRKLKIHRREVMKKKAKKLETKRQSQSRFLPDAVEFEAYQRQIHKLPQDTVDKAKNRLFSNVKNGQPTLSQWLGCSSKVAASEEKKVEEEVVEAADVGEKLDTESTVAFVDEVAVGQEPSQNSDGVEVDQEYSIQKPQHVSNYNSIVWSQGKRTTAKGAGCKPSESLWGALRTIPEEEDVTVDDPPINTSSQMSSWDAMFSEKNDDEGLDHLFGLFEDSSISIPSSQSITQTNLAPDQNVSMSMLSQAGQEKASAFCTKISANKAKLALLEKACPNWQENISFAFFQKEEADLTQALDNVKNARNLMEQKKREFLEAWERQHIALEVFESALTTSLDRVRHFGQNAPPPCPEVPSEGGFLTALTQENNEKGDDIVHEEHDEGDGVSEYHQFSQDENSSMDVLDIKN